MYLINLMFDYSTISINVHCTGISFSIVVGVNLCGVVLVWTVVTAVANFVLVKIKLARIVKQRAVVLLWNENGC